MATLERIAADIGGSAASLMQKIDEGRSEWIDLDSDDLFYTNKGRIYAYYLLLRELGHDFAPVIRDRQLARAWGDMVEGFRTAALLHPWVVTNGAPDGQALPNHLAAQGFFLLRARFQLYEIRDILLK
jgi:hypothetical protein